MQYAAYNGHMEAVKLLVEQHHADVNFVNQVCDYAVKYTVCMVYLAVVLIWRSGKF